VAKLKVTQVRSTIGAKPKVRESVRSLGLKRIHHTVVVDDSPVTRGYVQAVRHLVTVEAVSEAAGAGATEAKD
jgi:large subunit ribosomal protein L30